MGDSITNSIKEKNKTNDAHDKNATIFYDFDVILSDIGGLKKYQLFLVSLVYWITLPAGLLFKIYLKKDMLLTRSNFCF